MFSLSKKKKKKVFKLANLMGEIPFFKFYYYYQPHSTTTIVNIILKSGMVKESEKRHDF